VHPHGAKIVGETGLHECLRVNVKWSAAANPKWQFFSALNRVREKIRFRLHALRFMVGAHRAIGIALGGLCSNGDGRLNVCYDSLRSQIRLAL
jgi:hypothetical protein